MKKTAMILLCAAALAVGAVTASAESETKKAVYLGVKDYGSSAVNKDTKPDFEYNFFVDGENVTYLVDNGSPDDDSLWSYDIQNTLQEGSLYEITVNEGVVTEADNLEDDEDLVKGTIGALTDKTVVIGTKSYALGSKSKTWRINREAGGASVEAAEAASGETVWATLNSNGTVTALYLTDISVNVVYPVSGTPGRKTLKNFLSTALMPVGTTLYMFGGGWNWQDTGTSRFVCEIGVPESWISFFQSQDMNYTFKSQDYASGDLMENADPANSYYPYYGWNEYNYAGVDCSAYIAWTTYNTINKKSGKSGYLTNSKRIASSYAGRSWGTLSTDFNKPKNSRSSDFKPGDIISIDGHAWITLGTCSDGSILILHSSPTLSYTNEPGGGPQISAIGDSEDCKAFKLAEEYMTKYYPEWSSRYPVVLRDYETMTNIEAEGTGKFSWDVSGDGVLTDPDGYQEMSGEEVLADLFGEE